MARATKTRTAATKKAPRERPATDKWNEVAERREFRELLRARLKDILDASNVPERGRGSFMALVTHRSKQATALWLNPNSGGLPDIIALRQLALAFNVDPAYLLGLSKVARRTGRVATAGEASDARMEWLEDVDEVLDRRAGTEHSFIMDNDEMEPTISRGALVMVDCEVNSPVRSGLFAVESGGRVTVRLIETRLGGGLSLRCENKKYAEQLSAKKVTDLKKHSVRIVGRVVGWLDATWR